jgi:pyruvate/2-oxoglutarate dehydrogenase complex dihydrolipoamide acyltransferase (E2) component
MPGDVVAKIEAMKMEASITTPVAGTVTRIALARAAQVDGGDLIMVIALRGAGVAPGGFAARGVGGHLGTDEQESRLLMGDRAMLGATRDDEQVAGAEIDPAAPPSPR